MKITIISGHLSGKGGTETVISQLINADKVNEYTMFLGDLNGDNKWLKSIEKSSHIKHASNHFKILKLLGTIFFLMTTDSQVLLALNTKYIKLAKICNVFRWHKYTIVSWIHFSLKDEKTISSQNLKLADYHFAISTGIKKQMLSYGIDSNHIQTVFNPVPNRSIVKRTDEKGVLNLTYIGRVQYKSQKNLSELFSALKEYDKPWKLRIVGTGNKEDLELCKRYLRVNELTDSVSWTGWVSNPWEYIKDTDYVVLTSKYEGMPQVLTEAISRGIPCISSDCDTGIEDIINKNNGFLYKSGASSELAKVLNIANEAKQNQKFDLIKVKNTMNKFNVASYVKNINEGYSSALRGRNNA